MGENTSQVFLLGGVPWKHALSETLHDLGWLVWSFDTCDALLAAVGADLPAAIIDGTGSKEIGARIRALAPPANGTPVIAIDGDEPRDLAGLLARLRHFAGPLEDHALRRRPFSARYRLVRLIGFDEAEAMRARFEDALREALADPQAAPAHRLAGIAGMVGEGDLSALWSRVDRGEVDALPLALEATRRALGEG